MDPQMFEQNITYDFIMKIVKVKGVIHDEKRKFCLFSCALCEAVAEPLERLDEGDEQSDGDE